MGGHAQHHQMSPSPPMSIPVGKLPQRMSELSTLVTLRLLDVTFQHDQGCFLYQSWRQSRLIDVFLRSTFDHAGDGDHLVPAHRLVLCAYSNYCEKIFQSYPAPHFGAPERAVPVIVLSVPGEDLIAAVRLMYDGQIRVDERRLARLEKCFRLLEMDNILIVESGRRISVSPDVSSPIICNYSRQCCHQYSPPPMPSAVECFRPYPVIMRSVSGATIAPLIMKEDETPIVVRKAWSEPATPTPDTCNEDDYWARRKRRQNTYHAAKYRDRRRQRIEMLFQERERLERDQRQLVDQVQRLETAIRKLILVRAKCADGRGSTVCPRCLPARRRSFSGVDALREHFRQEHL